MRRGSGARLCFLRLRFSFCYTVVTQHRVSPLGVPSFACIVGALSDGHIIESGDNANGYYVRFADGTQVCYDTVTVTPSWVGGAEGWITKKAVTFPAVFISVPKVLGQTIDPYVGSRGTFVGHVAATVTDALIDIRAVASTSTASLDMTYFAIGKWK